MNIRFRNKFVLRVLLLLVVVMIAISLSGVLFAKNIYTFDTQEMRISRYWQGLNTSYWTNWFIQYYENISEMHDRLYRSVQRAGARNYFKTGEIKYRPAIVWFAYADGTMSSPRVIKSSGSKKYDAFNVKVIRRAKVPVFPVMCKRVFMFDGEIEDVLIYLKKQGVMPKDYMLMQSISPAQIKWEKL